jgi:hypothetical protein
MDPSNINTELCPVYAPFFGAMVSWLDKDMPSPKPATQHLVCRLSNVDSDVHTEADKGSGFGRT